MGRSATLREVQLVQLEIAREIKRVCEENGIRYFLDSGTLLGAVRHLGFIPWDDDLDIGMLRSEYEKFLKIAPGKLGKDYELQTWHNEPGHGYAFAKVRKKGTLYVERICEKVRMPLGIYVDILPYDVFPSGRLQRFFQGSVLRFCRGTILMKCGYTPWAAFPDRKMQIMSHIKYLPFQAAAVFCRKDRLVRRFEKTAVRYDRQKPEQLMEQAGASSYGKWVVPASCLSSYSELPFEGEPFSCPGDPHLYLSTVYGDYMTPPPENKRGNRHQIVRAEIADE